MGAQQDPDALLIQYERLVREGFELEGRLAACRLATADLRGKIVALTNGSAPTKPPRAPAVVAANVDAPDDGKDAAPVGESMMSKVIAETIRVVREMGGKVTTEEYAKRVEMEKNGARVRLIRATDKGFLVREAAGVYRLPKESAAR